MALSDRRCHPRWNARGIKVWLIIENCPPERCSIIDASRNGVLIKSSLFLVPGMKVELAFSRAYSTEVTRLFRRWAQVARTTPNRLAFSFVNKTRPRRAPIRRIGSRLRFE